MEQQQPQTLVTMANTQAQPHEWPFTPEITQLIFSHLDQADFPQTARTCGFFYTNIHATLMRILRDLCKKNDLDLPPAEELPHFPVPIIYKCIEIFAHPIRRNVKECRPVIFGYDVRPSVGVLTVGQRCDRAELCLTGTFVLPFNSNGVFNIHQFIAGINKQGHVYLERLSEEDAKKILLLEEAAETFMGDFFNIDIINALSSSFIASGKRESITFEQLVSTVLSSFSKDTLESYHREEILKVIDLNRKNPLKLI